MNKKKWRARDFYIPLIPVPLSVALAFLTKSGFDFAFFLCLGFFLFIYLPFLIVFTDKVGKK